MKFKFYTYSFSIIFSLVIGLQNYSLATAITAVATGNWSATSTWSPAQVPVAGDDVTIGAFTVTIDADAACKDLSLTAATSNLKVNGGRTFTLGGNYSSMGTASGGVNGPGTIVVIGNITINSNFTESGTFPNLVIGDMSSANTVTIDTTVVVYHLTVTNNSTLAISAADSMVVAADFTVTGTGSGNGAVTGQGVLNFTADANHTITGIATISVSAVLTTTGSSPQITFLGSSDPGGPAMLNFTGDSVVNVKSGPKVGVNQGAELTFSSNTLVAHRSSAYWVNAGKMTVNSTAVGAFTIGSSNRFDNEGTLIMNGGATGTFVFGSSSTFMNNGILTFNGTAVNAFTIGTSNTFINGPYGVITFTSTTGNNLSFPSSNHFTNNGIINAKSNINFGSTVWFTNNGTINTSASGTIFTISNNNSSYAENIGTITSTGTGNISLGSSAEFFNNGTVTLPGSIVGANATSSVWTQGPANAMLDIKGALLTTGKLNADTAHNTVKYSGTSQTIKVPAAGHYDKLEIASSTGASMSANVTVNSELILTSGKIITGANTLIIDTTGIITGGSTASYVNGNMQKNFRANTVSLSSFKFEIGDANVYAPAAVAFSSISTGGNLKTSTTGAEHPAIGSSLIDPTLSVNRYWTLANAGMVFITADATFNWSGTDVDGGVNSTNLIVGKYDNATWTYPAVASPLVTSVQATGIISFSDFAVGELKIVGVPTIAAGNELNLYPNPSVSGSFTIALDNFNHTGSIKIFDSVGKEIFNQSLSEISNGKVDLKAGPGIYFVNFSDGDKQYCQKMVVQ